MFNINHLKWDSLFFEKKIGLLTIDSESIDGIIFDSYDCVYIFNEKEIKSYIPSNNVELIYLNKKIIFEKYLDQEAEISLDSSIEEINQNEKKSDKLIELCTTAGLFSRFKLDPNFPDSKFRELYKLWYLNSVNSKIADKVFAFFNDGIPIGIITVKLNLDVASIGLIAVDSKFRGLGIGKKLILAGENWSKKNGAVKMNVATQEINSDACFFYRNAGFKLVSKLHNYHYWNKCK